MSKKEIRVGTVGADSKASLAKVSHGPPIQGLSGLKLAAVAGAPPNEVSDKRLYAVRNRSEKGASYIFAQAM